MTLFDQALDQRLWFTRALSPYDMVAGPDYSGEIELVWIKFVRHRRVRLGIGNFRIAQIALDRRQIQRIFLTGD